MTDYRYTTVWDNTNGNSVVVDAPPEGPLTSHAKAVDYGIKEGYFKPGDQFIGGSVGGPNLDDVRRTKQNVEAPKVRMCIAIVVLKVCLRFKRRKLFLK